jgi:hypothetical protein
MRQFINQRMPEIMKAKANAQTHFNLCQALATLNPNSSAVLNCEAAILEQAPVDQIWPTIENLIQRQQPWQTPLRLLCMLSIVSDGLRPPLFHSSRQEFLQAYGFHFLPLLLTLERLGFLTMSGAPAGPILQQLQAKRSLNYSQLRKSLSLIPPNGPSGAPQSLAAASQDLSFGYSFSGYSPLSCKLLEMIGKNGGSFAAVDRIIKDPPAISASFGSSGATGPPIALLVFLGGCTSTELSCLRWLHWKKQFPPVPNSELVFLTTQLLTGSSIIEQLK